MTLECVNTVQEQQKRPLSPPVFSTATKNSKNKNVQNCLLCVTGKWIEPWITSVLRNITHAVDKKTCCTGLKNEILHLSRFASGHRFTCFCCIWIHCHHTWRTLVNYNSPCWCCLCFYRCLMWMINISFWNCRTSPIPHYLNLARSVSSNLLWVLSQSFSFNVMWNISQF